jgi:hypothetical protein
MLRKSQHLQQRGENRNIAHRFLAGAAKSATASP